MLKDLLDRLACAVVGIVVGGLFSVLLWAALGTTFFTSTWRRSFAFLSAPLSAWVTIGMASFGLVGFIFKDGVGSVLGAAMSLFYDVRTNAESKLPAWITLLLIAAGVLALWLLGVL